MSIAEAAVIGGRGEIFRNIPETHKVVRIRFTYWYQSIPADKTLSVASLSSDTSFPLPFTEVCCTLALSIRQDMYPALLLTSLVAG
jgi:hypothetical protein